MNRDLLDGSIENLLQAHLGQGGALDVLARPYSFCSVIALLKLNGFHPGFRQLGLRFWVIALVHLCTDEDDGHVGRMVPDFWDPLGMECKRTDTEQFSGRAAVC